MFPSSSGERERPVHLDFCDHFLSHSLHTHTLASACSFPLIYSKKIVKPRRSTLSVGANRNNGRNFLKLSPTFISFHLLAYFSPLLRTGDSAPHPSHRLLPFLSHVEIPVIFLDFEQSFYFSFAPFEEVDTGDEGRVRLRTEVCPTVEFKRRVG